MNKSKNISSRKERPEQDTFATLCTVRITLNIEAMFIKEKEEYLHKLTDSFDGCKTQKNL